jgi:hypothetical protein
MSKLIQLPEFPKMAKETQTRRLRRVLEIFEKYPHNLECRDGYVEIVPKNWRKVSKEHKNELKELGFKWYKELKWGDFRLDHWEVSTLNGPIFS